MKARNIFQCLLRPVHSAGKLGTLCPEVLIFFSWTYVLSRKTLENTGKYKKGIKITYYHEQLTITINILMYFSIFICIFL